MDNQLPTGASTLRTAFSVDIGETARGANSANRFIVLAEVEGVDDFVDDPEVHVRLYRGFAAPGEPCGSPSPGGVYQIDRAGLRPGGSTADDAAVVLRGSIAHGRMRVSSSPATAFTLQWPFRAGTTLVLPTHQVTLAMELRADGAARGNFGGWVPGEDVLATISAVAPDYSTVLQSVIGGMADIPIHGSCGDALVTPPTYGGVSIGFGFDAVRVRLDPSRPVVDSPALGSCELASPTDAGRD